MTNQEIAEKVKILLKDTAVDDDILALQIEIVIQKIKNYCGREDIPAELALIIVDIVSKTYMTTVSQGKVAESIKRGDTEIKYASETKAITSIFDDYLSLLQPFIVIKQGSYKVRFY